MTRLALIDGDEIAYKVALAYQRKYYEVRKDDKLLWRVRYKEEAVESIMSRDDLEITEKIEPLDPKGFEEKISNEISKILFNTNSTDIRIYLSGNNNFRYKLATLLPYKGNRSVDKPIHLGLVQNELKERGAEWVEYLEADDLLSANFTSLFESGEDPIICSSDKDLRTVSSINYNISKKEMSLINKDQALLNFYYQLLIGDSTDNIPSPYGLGQVKALAYLTAPFDFKHLKSFYSSFLLAKNKDGTYKTKWYDGRGVDEILWEVGNLLHMHRTLDPNERWELPNGK